MEGLKLKEKEIVVPGEVIAEGMGFLPSRYIYRDGDKLIASKLGVLDVEGNVLKLRPLSGIYVPRPGDMVICEIMDILISGWRLDTYSAYPAVLNLREATSSYIAKGADLTRYFNIGDHVVAQITNVTSQKLIDVTMKGPGLRKLRDGRVIKVDPNKVPRIIGKRGSMVSMIKDATNCRISVGQNGIIWMEGMPKNQLIAVKAIREIEKKAHTAGLTEKIKLFLEKNATQKIAPKIEQKKAVAPKLG